MCGRFSLATELETIMRLVAGLEAHVEFVPRYNIAPTQTVITLLNDGSNALIATRWGLIPSWARDAAIGNRLINARAETLHEKPSFKNLFKKKRCLIFADGFYEWQKTTEKGRKVPWFFRFKTGEPFAFAGLWDRWKDRSREGALVISSTIITVGANTLVEPIHDRMPAIVRQERYGEWLAAEELTPERLRHCLEPYPAAEMEAYRLSTLVNDPSIDSAGCRAPAPPG
jgi:putative SOS response-associated peptidase YedK